MLKIASDLGFYYTFAGFFAVLMRAHPGVLLSALAVESVAFALSYLLQEREALRFAPFALAALLFLLPGVGLADAIFMLIPATYTVFLAYKRIYVPEWDKQVDIFSLFWKLFLVFSILGVVFGKTEAVSAIVIPAGIVAFTSCIILTRSLRHEPEVYCSPRYQVMNLGAVLLVSVAAGLLGSHAFLMGCFAVLKLIYNYLISPVLYVLIYAILGIIRVLAWLFSWLKIKKPEEKEPPKLNMDGAKELFKIEDQEFTENVTAKYIFMGIGILIAAVILFFVFRYLARRGGKGTAESGMTDRRYTLDSAARAEAKEEGTNVQKIRALYRKFLKMCQRQGVVQQKSDTSADVNFRCGDLFSGEDTAALRDIYIEARYNGEATRESAARAKELYASLKAQRVK